MLVSQIGRRIFRQRLETGDRDGDIEQRRVGHLFNSFNFHFMATVPPLVIKEQ